MRGLAPGVACVALLSACAASDPAADEVAASASRAGLVMARPPQVSADTAAARVVGGVLGSDSIELMSADGDNLTGHAVLRITKSAPRQDGFERTTLRAVRCEAYDFAAVRAGGGPAQVECPPGPTMEATPETTAAPPPPGG